MALIVPEESQQPYRFGMTLVCIGALFNWLGLADHHTKPVPAVRYIGVGLVASGAVLICMAMCFWMNSVRDDEDDESVDHVHVISVDPPVRRLDEKPPDYATVVDLPPPSYDDAIKLDPQRLMTTVADTCVVTMPDDKTSSDGGGVGSATVAEQQPSCQPAAAAATTTTTTTLARAIRKSIRDIRKQLTANNTVGDAADVEQQQQSSGSERRNDTGGTAVVAAPKSDDVRQVAN